MGIFSRARAWLRGVAPAAGYASTANIAGFIQTPTSPAPDAKPLVETEQVSAIVGRCVNVISEDAATVPLRLFDVTDPLKPKELVGHPAIQLWRHVNPVESPVPFIQQAFADLICEGNFFAWLDVDAGGVPRSMIRLQPEQVTVIPHPTRIISGYKWKKADGVSETYDAQEIMHIRTRNPNPVYRGLGLLVRARDQIRFEYQLRSFKEQQLKNGIPTSLVIKVKRSFASDAEWERFRQETWERLRGIHNAGKPMFIRAEDVEVEVIPRPKEDEVVFIDSLKYTRNEFAMLFGVPPSRLSDYSESFRANASEQGRTYWQDTIMSWHALFTDYLNSTFIPRWFPNEVGLDMRPKIAFAYDYSQVRALALSMRDMATVQEILIRSAMRSPADATVAMGDAMPDDEKAKDLYMNGKPLGEAGDEAAAGSQPSGNEIRPDGETDPADPAEEGRAAAGAGATLGPGMGRQPRPPLRAVAGGIRVRAAQKQFDLFNDEIVERPPARRGTEPKRGEAMSYLAHMSVRGEEESDGTRRIRGIASTKRADRQNTWVDPKSLAKAARLYDRRAGKMFWNHSWAIPIGVRESIEAVDDELRFVGRIGKGFPVPVAVGFLGMPVLMQVDDLWEIMKQELTTSLSIAFLADEERGATDEKTGKQEASKLLVTDLLEVSVVTIPSNPDCEFTITRAADDRVYAAALRLNQGAFGAEGTAAAAAVGSEDGAAAAEADWSRVREELDQWRSQRTTS